MIDLVDYRVPALDPKAVSTWLALPGSQLPRETGKLIGQPAQPARKKGGSGKYSFLDTILIKLGRRLTELGVTPHRVRACIEAVRKSFDDLVRDYRTVTLDARQIGGEAIEVTEDGPFYLVGREYSTGFSVCIVSEGSLTDYLTGAGLAEMEYASAIEAAKERGITISAPEQMPELAEAGKEYIQHTDPASPVIVQNVSEFVRHNARLLAEHVKQG